MSIHTRRLPSIFGLFLCLAAVHADSVLLIIADDLGRDSLAEFNDDLNASLPPTPTIDSLAASGIRFNRAYAYSTCSPTRASILTGRYNFRTGLHSPEVNTLMPNEYTLAEAIVDSGAIEARLAQFGKWHLGGTNSAPNEIGGWPHFSGSIGGGVPDYNRWTKVTDGMSTNRYTNYATTDVVDDAVSWIGEQGTEDWFLWVAFNAPHTPYHKPPDDLHDYNHLTGTDEDIEANPRDYYEAMLQAMDTEIGRLLMSIDRNTTTVIFIGDNGTPNSVLQEPFPRRHGKGSLYEGGINGPLIVSGAAVSFEQENTQNDSIVHSVDLYTTILDLLEIDSSELLPTKLVYDSQSFYPLLGNAATTHTREYAYSAQNGDTATGFNFMITNESYKWILSDDGGQEFYYLSDGLNEEINRIENLSTEAEAALSAFEIQANQLINIPKVHRCHFEDGAFHIEIGWFADADLNLEIKTDLQNEDWQAVTGFNLSDEGESVIRISHSTASSTAFYRVVSE